ncbi:hypothetical protein TM1040_3461 (plasmid) [Ruegeria sp. TM1040]|jgi:hypothetical protein|uniref:hypothetical protein n=1 Tax=Ruegeria sp. (strain TM1040) TaxID=292414 RepID=UPI0000463191|nr:hypothetical protein [Ruegeria sp. TM1040]ABF62433.1 hypothetical protein TM1040_3461 [Ruegeria sp. TM1040]MDF9301720.1 hypothetical protein [Tritonibacter mobilis]
MTYRDDKTDNEDLAYGQTPWGCASTRKRLDSESMMLLRANLSEPLNRADSWPTLRELLRGKGFDMKRREGRLRLVDLQSRVEICTFGLLGHPRAELEKRFGAPMQAH